MWTNAEITTAGYYSRFADGQEAVLSSNDSSTCANTYTLGFSGWLQAVSRMPGVQRLVGIDR